jgi:hypothetical protein
VSIVEIARLFDFVREAGQNHGARVNGIQVWGGGSDGDSWCCWMATMWLDLFFKGQSPIPRTGSCQQVYALAKQNGWLVDDPRPGDFFVYVNAAGLAHHIGLVTANAPLAGIAGNTSRDGISVNGDGCYEHALTVPRVNIKFIRVPGVS